VEAHGKVVGSGQGDQRERDPADRGHHHLVGQPYCQDNDITGSSWSTVDLRSISLPRPRLTRNSSWNWPRYGSSTTPGTSGW